MGVNIDDSFAKTRKRLGVIIGKILAIIGVISSLCTIYSNNSTLKKICVFITSICICGVIVLIVTYILEWLNSNTKMKDLETSINKLKEEIKEEKSMMQQSISVIEKQVSNVDPSMQNKLASIEAKIEELNKNIEERPLAQTSITSITSQVSNMESSVMEKMNSLGNDIVSKVSSSSNKICPVKRSAYVENSEDVNHILYELIRKKNGYVKRIRIICYGRNGFGGAVSYLISQNLDIDVSIVVYNTEAGASICRDDDRVIIERNIRSWLNTQSPQIRVYVTKIPPMIRAAVAYSEDKNNHYRPIWGTIQSYRFAPKADGTGITLEKPKESLISVCDEKETTADDFNSLVYCFEEEFNRLKNLSSVPEIVTTADGKKKLFYRERKDDEK